MKREDIIKGMPAKTAAGVLAVMGWMESSLFGLVNEEKDFQIEVRFNPETHKMDVDVRELSRD